jgi:hypothetical protein
VLAVRSISSALEFSKNTYVYVTVFGNDQSCWHLIVSSSSSGCILLIPRSFPTFQRVLPREAAVFSGHAEVP